MKEEKEYNEEKSDDFGQEMIINGVEDAEDLDNQIEKEEKKNEKKEKRKKKRKGD